MKLLFATISLVWTCTFAKAQDTTGLKRLIARFEAIRTNGNREYGTGFIVAQQGDTLYLVTAGHVLRELAPDAPLKVIIGNLTDTLHATVLLNRDPLKGDKEDMAVCAVTLKGYEYPKIKDIDTLGTGVPVFYYKNQHLSAELGDNEQTLITWDNETHTYRVYMPSVDGGDSGGPVFTNLPDTRLSGIVISGDQSCEILRISHVMAIIKKEFPTLNLN